MKITIKNLPVPAAVVVLSIISAACTKEASTRVQSSVDLDEIEFRMDSGSFEAEVETKATAVTALSSFNVHCFTGTPGSAETPVFNVGFSGSTSYTGTTKQFWPSTDPGYHFYASNATITPAGGGATISAANSTDIVVAKCMSPTYKQSNTLTFNHIFARVGEVTVTAPNDGSAVSNLSITFTPKTGGTYLINSGTWSSASNGSAVVLANATGVNASKDTYCVPGAYTLNASYTLTKGAYSKNFTKSANVTLPVGKISAISTTLPNSDVSEITFSVTVENWGTNTINTSWN